MNQRFSPSFASSFAFFASSFAVSVSTLVGCSGATTPPVTADGGVGAGEDASSLPDSATPGTDSSIPTDGATGTTAAQACADWAAARCKRFDACSDGLYVSLHWADEAACEANGASVCATALAAPGTAASAATFEACANALPASACADFLGENPAPACAALAGSVATGSACLTSSQCQSTYCAVPANATCGVCAAVPKAGDACAVAADCGARGGLTCSANVCVALGAASASCGKGAPCGVGLSCVGVNAKKGTLGTCQPAAGAVGAACDPKQATAAGCDATLELSCDPATSLCVENTVVAAGATCGQTGADGALARCATSGTCEVPASDAGTEDAGASDAGAAPITGTCLAAAAPGSACDTARGPGCIPAAKCVTGDAGTAGTCQAPRATACL